MNEVVNEVSNRAKKKLTQQEYRVIILSDNYWLRLPVRWFVVLM
jgi:hypothetical protein